MPVGGAVGRRYLLNKRAREIDDLVLELRHLVPGDDDRPFPEKVSGDIRVLRVVFGSSADENGCGCRDGIVNRNLHVI